jgi:hypothetical protein
MSFAAKHRSATFSFETAAISFPPLLETLEMLTVLFADFPTGIAFPSAFTVIR